jgi:hypothetical protein
MLFETSKYYIVITMNRSFYNVIKDNVKSLRVKGWWKRGGGKEWGGKEIWVEKKYQGIFI